MQLAVMGTEHLEDPPELEDVQDLTPFGSTPSVSSTGGLSPSLPRELNIIVEQFSKE